MTAQAANRGEALFDAGETLGLVPRWLDRLWAGSLARLLNRVDRGLERGSVRIRLPDGSERRLGGRAPGFDAEVELHDGRALLRLASAGSVGCYQGWEAGEWSSSDPVKLFALFCENAQSLGSVSRARGPWRWLGRALHWRHRNSRAGAARNIHLHYDLGNDFYAAWLDPTMIYSSARFDDDRPGASLSSSDLGQGQMRKVDALVRRLALKDGDKVLEVGAGWGTLAASLAERHNADVLALSLSDEQIAYARKRWSGIAAGSVEFRKQDYRDASGAFDAIVSVEMVEAVGEEYWPDFFDCLARNLKPGGRAALQYILIDDAIFPAYRAGSDFIQTYIFPGGMLVSESAFRALAAERGFRWENRANFGLDYAETLRIWRANFDAAAAEGRLPDGFDERFIRLWRFYLMYCEAGFRSGLIDVAQVTLVKPL